ncbi:Oligoendopeptidase F [Clostridiaceae bacterium JG1575]|nr:Oligoendopeptidase F [Clostridiaceae bacterium JG1575]
MKFNEMQYLRPDFDALFQEMKDLLVKMEASKDADAFQKAVSELDERSVHLETMASLAYVRHTIDTNDAFYKTEQDLMDEQLPRFQEIATEMGRIFLESPLRPQLEERYGKHQFEKYEVQQKTFKPEIVPDLVEENKLASAYQKLTASAEIDFEGEIRNLSGLTPFLESTDRDMRKRANAATWNWFEENREELDRLYDDLVRVRTRIAKKLGFDTFTPVGYARMGRMDWTVEDARVYRQQIADSVVPLTQKLYRQQAQRIGIQDMKNYDFSLKFLSGNPTPKGEEAYMVEQAQGMYKELSPETDAFFSTMVKQDLMDLTTKKGKANGGYMTSFPEFEVPFIFSNFNGTSGDVDVLTHEAGHAFQGWIVRKVRPSFLKTMTSEVAEIHSMSMEFFTHPWMERFFGEDTEKYYYAHVADTLQFLPYGASIDELQEWVYENPEATPAERKAKYREIEKKYLPHLDYDGVSFLEEGGRWQKQLHVYLYPFYYLDYTLSQVCAHQFFNWDRKDHEAAWKAYLNLCEQTGRKPFKKLVPDAGLKSPFEPGTIASITPELERYLEGLDYSKIK